MTALSQRRPAERASMRWSSTSATCSRPPRRASSTLSTTPSLTALTLCGAIPSPGGRAHPQRSPTVSSPLLVPGARLAGAHDSAGLQSLLWCCELAVASYVMGASTPDSQGSSHPSHSWLQVGTLAVRTTAASCAGFGGESSALAVGCSRIDGALGLLCRRQSHSSGSALSSAVLACRTVVEHPRL